MNTALDVMEGTVISLSKINYAEALKEYENINMLHGVNHIKLSPTHLQELQNNHNLLVHDAEYATSIELDNMAHKDRTVIKWTTVGSTYYCNIGDVIIKLTYVYDKKSSYEPNEFKVTASISSSTNSFQQIIGKVSKMTVGEAKTKALTAVITECKRLQQTTNKVLKELSKY